MNFRHVRRPEVAINLTPLIDVVFLLLIFFMVSSSFSELTQLVVDLPEAEGSPASGDATLMLSIDVDGKMMLDGQPVPNDAAGLMRAMADRIQGSTDRSVMLSADALTHHQHVVTAMDVASRLGLERLTIATESPSDD
ncbi:MAG: ExbD/TolR family protein [Luminiphilus sp.]